MIPRTSGWVKYIISKKTLKNRLSALKKVEFNLPKR